MKDKKPFRDTKLGKFLLGSKSSMGEAIGDLLPDSGLLGVVKKLIDTDPDLTADEKEQAHRHLVDMYDIEVRDRESARRREVNL